MVKEKQTNKNAQNVEHQSQESSVPEDGGKIWQDERFQHLIKDPRFKNLPKTARKVKIDKRFQSMFTDNKFKVKYTVDKYGRRVNQSNAEDLRKYYELESGASSEDEDNERNKEEKAISNVVAEESGEGSSASDVETGENDELASDTEKLPTTLKERLCDPDIDYARGEGRLLTDSSSDDETSEDEDDEVLNIDHVWGELDMHADMTEESTKRLAVCNMDWDRIRAVDLMVLFCSFLPPGGSILSVKIYLSEYGKERLAEEERSGPQELIGLGTQQKSKKKASDSEEDEENLVRAEDSDEEEGNDYHMEKLRQYQLNRLRYYYAVVECDSVETADKIYKECDGTEYESSATHVDLRYIPDDTSFDDDTPTDVCTELPDTSTFKPRQFTTTALQQVKVDLTWDETALERKELGDKLSSGKLEEINDKDLRKIVAYSSEEDEDDEIDTNENENKNIEKEKESDNKTIPNTESNDSNKQKKKAGHIDKYKALLAEINEKEKEEKNKKYEMEFTWDVTEKEEKNDQEAESINAKEKENQNLTPIEKVLKKRSEKNKKRKEERKRRGLLAKGIDPDTVDAENASDSDDVPDGIDMNDPYFAEEFANGDFVDPKAKKTQKTKKKRAELEEEEEEQEKQTQELALLLDDDEDDGKQHFSLEKILKSEQDTKSKRKRRKQLKKSKSAIAEKQKEVEDNFVVNVNDERFKNIYTSHLYNIDPTDSHFKKTKGMEELIKEKFKRREDSEVNKTKPTESENEAPEAKRPKKQIENSLLVKSLKRKLQQQQQQQQRR